MQQSTNRNTNTSKEITYPDDVVVMTTDGAYSSPLSFKVKNGKVWCRRDIDKDWTLVSHSRNYSLEKIKKKVEEWLDPEPPRDIDDRVIPLTF